MTVTLGISFSHNGSVALIRNGEIEAAIQAERLARVKRQPLFLGKNTALTKACVDYCLNHAGLHHSDIDSVALSTPWELKKIDDKILFECIGGTPKKYSGTFYVPHHLCHMEYIAHFGDSKPGIILIIDGSGSWEADRKKFNVAEASHKKLISRTYPQGKEVVSAYWFDGQKGSLIYRFSPHPAQSGISDSYSHGLLQSIGHCWEWASKYCFGTSHEAGKVMGLAGFRAEINDFDKIIMSFTEDREINIDYHALTEHFTDANLFGLDITQKSHFEEVAYLVQRDTEATVLKLLAFLKVICPTDTVYFCGGVALNVLLNEKIIKSGLFDNVFLNGSVEDNGTAIGAALSASLEMGVKRKSAPISDCYGRSYSEDQILQAIASYEFSYQILDPSDMYRRIAEILCSGYVIGWFQGRSEFGPRALGNRSILANPINPSTKHMLDHFMKSRDRYRPYAPVVLQEDVHDFFDMKGTSPVMMRNAQVLDKRLASITHADGSARVQTVNIRENEPLYRLLSEFKNITGIPVLLNTSFNLPGEPIVESPEDALSSFNNGSLDFLCLERVLIAR